jgi:DNA gyrase subunit B
VPRDPESEIVALEGLEAVRMRPAMYVGPVTASEMGNRLLKEALCCARDEALQGRCTQATVTLRADGSAMVRDDGPGLPLQVTPSGLRVAETYLTKLYACASGKTPAVAKTTCTVGLAVLNALCHALRLRVFQDGVEWRQSYAKGVPTEPLTPVGPTAERGTELSFVLDRGVLPGVEFVASELVSWAETSLLGLALTVQDEASGRNATVSPKAG